MVYFLYIISHPERDALYHLYRVDYPTTNPMYCTTPITGQLRLTFNP